MWMAAAPMGTTRATAAMNAGHDRWHSIPSAIGRDTLSQIGARSHQPLPVVAASERGRGQNAGTARHHRTRDEADRQPRAGGAAAERRATARVATSTSSCRLGLRNRMALPRREP